MRELKLKERISLLGSAIFKILELKGKPYLDKEQIKAYQLKYLRQRLYEAKKYVPLYRERAKYFPNPEDIKTLKDWSLVPLLSKADLLSVPLEKRLDERFKEDDLIISKSSGSTGQALDVYYDLESFYLFMAAGLRMYSMQFPYRPWHSQTYIYTSPYPLKSLFGLYPLNFISTLTPIEETIEALIKNPPDFLVCYPSHLRAIADKMKPEHFKKIRPRAINVNSEMSTASERHHLSKLFSCPVLDEYSSEELTRIASQCSKEIYHIFDDINYMEVVDDQGLPLAPGKIGNLIGTNLHNRGMPLLRYKQGDRGSICEDKTCSCGRTFRHLESFQGRQNDAFVLESGESLSSGYLLDLTYGVLLDYPLIISAFCLVQEKPNDWVLELVPGSKWEAYQEKNIRDGLLKNLNLAYKNIRIETKIVESVSKTKSGKANPIISRLKQNAQVKEKNL